MVVRKRLSRFLLPLLAYGVASGAVYYFLESAKGGQRGMTSKIEIKAAQYRLGQELDALKVERTNWEKRVALLRTESVDRDMLDERARHLLNRVHPDDIVIILGDQRPPR